MARYRKKPVVIEAWPVRDLLRDAASNWKGLPEPIRQLLRDKRAGVGIVFAHDCIFVKTLEGEMRAEKDDWIIHGVKGELYPCKPDIFATTYEAV